MPILYFDVLAGYNYDWSLGKTGPEVLAATIKEGKVVFICNSYGNISKGDCHGIVFDDEYSKTVFLLKYKFPLIEAEIAEQYVRSKTYGSGKHPFAQYLGE